MNSRMIRALYFVGRCGLGRNGETCKGCARKARKAKRAASRHLRRFARQGRWST